MAISTSHQQVNLRTLYVVCDRRLGFAAQHLADGIEPRSIHHTLCFGELSCGFVLLMAFSGSHYM